MVCLLYFLIIRCSQTMIKHVESNKKTDIITLRVKYNGDKIKIFYLEKQRKH